MENVKGKLFFFDFDGTVWFGKFGEKTLKALKILHEKGGKLFYNSGRSKGNTYLEILKAIPFDGFLYGGGHIEIGNEEVFRQDVESRAIKKVIETEIKYGLTILYEGVRGVYKRKGILPQFYCDELDDIFALTDTSLYPITKFSIIKTQKKGEITPVPKEVFDILSEDFFLVEFETYVEAMTKGLGKDFLISKTIQTLGADPEDTYAFGDSSNDVSAFKACRHNTAIGHAPEELKKMAEYITVEEENGVAEALEHFGFVTKEDYGKFD